MLNRRWWDLAAVAVSAVVVTFGLVFPPYGPQDWGTWSVVAGFLLVYVGYLRWRIGSEDPRHHAAITAILVAVVFAGTAFDSGAATLQAFAYPFLWITAPSTKRAIIANVLLALAVGAGYAVGLGPTGVLPGLGVGALSLAFSLALGLWITRIAEVGEERARLLAELQAAQGQLATMHRETGVTEERARLAREIHDTIAQSLTGLVMLAQRAERRLDAPSPDVPAARGDLGLIEEMAREALTEARGLVAAVSPSRSTRASPTRSAGSPPASSGRPASPSRSTCARRASTGSSRSCCCAPPRRGSRTCGSTRGRRTPRSASRRRTGWPGSSCATTASAPARTIRPASDSPGSATASPSPAGG